MSGSKIMFMIFKKMIVYSKHVRESEEKNVHEILENIQKNQMSFAKFKIHPPI